MTAHQEISRHVQQSVDVALEDTRVVLNDPATLAAARADPTGFVRGQVVFCCTSCPLGRTTR